VRLRLGAENDRKLFHVKPKQGNVLAAQPLPMLSSSLQLMSSPMTRHSFRTALLLTAFCAPGLHAAEHRQLRFEHKDWELACDNTRTCRAAGYQADDAETGVSVLLTRDAGPDQPVRLQLQLADIGGPLPSSVQMRINGRQLGTVTIDKDAKGELSAAQTTALLAAVLKDTPVSWTAASSSWVLSTAGANAVLLKMDEFQGRIGTPGALVRKGQKPESTVAAPLAAPALVAALVKDESSDPRLIPPKQRPILLAELSKTLPNDEDNNCDRYEDKVGKPDNIRIYRLSEQHLMVSIACWYGPYNSGDAHWVINVRPPYAPVMVTKNGTDYENGRIHANHKGRGIGDCMSGDTWTWDGRRFVHTSSMTTGMCKGIAAGGAWELPTLVVQVRKPK
jgi:hypothetical protein